MEEAGKALAAVETALVWGCDSHTVGLLNTGSPFTLPCF